MRLALTVFFLLVPAVVLVAAIRRDYLRVCPGPVLALGGYYLFVFAGAPLVIYNDALYSDGFAWSLVCVVLLFALFFVLLFGLRERTYVAWDLPQLVASTSVSVILLTSLWLYCGYIFALYTSRHGLPALFTLNLSQGPIDFYALRAEKSTSLSEGTLWYKLGMQTVPILIFVYSYAWKAATNSRLARVAFWAGLPCIVVLVNSFATKDGLVLLLENAMLVGLVLGSTRVFSRRFWLITLAVIGSIFVWLRLYLLDRGVYDVAKVFGRYLLHRIFGVYAEAHAYAYQIFPRQHDFYHGAAFGNPYGLLPFTPVNFSRDLGWRVMGHIVNYASPSITQGYANFGMEGILLVTFAMFLQLLVIQVVFKLLPRNILFFSLYILVISRTLFYGRQSFQTVVPEEWVVFVLGVVVVYYLATTVVKRLSGAASGTLVGEGVTLLAAQEARPVQG